MLTSAAEHPAPFRSCLHLCYIGRLDGKDLLVTAPIGSVLCDDFNVFKSTIKVVLFEDAFM
jgi:hypothetical protein